MNTDFDDWETDPDFIRDMGEIDQRWGSKRTVGSINMNELIDEVRRDHQKMREKFQHPSQRDHSEGFGGKFGVQHDRKDQSAHDYDYHEKLSKHTSQEISRKIITSSKSDFFKEGNGSLSDAKRSFLEKTDNTFQDLRSPPVAPKPDFGNRDLFKKAASTAEPKTWRTDSTTKVGEPRFEESTSSKRIIKEEKSSSSREIGDMPQAFRSIQDKIDAFKKEFEDIENKVTKKADLSKVIKKATNVEKNTNVQYVSRSDGSTPISPINRPTSTSPLKRERDFPKTNIKSLSEKFETLCRDDNDSFKRRTETKRKEFFDQIKNQVRETRKGLDGFDPIDDDSDDGISSKMRSQEKVQRSSPMGSKQFASKLTSSPSSRSSSRLSQDSQSPIKPKIYSRSETTREEVVSKIVKENDKVIENETKRKVERSSSCHGSSEDESKEEPSSIKFIDRELRTSPQQRTESPIGDRKIPIVEPEIKGGGLMARTLYDYTAAEDDEISFDVDDLITNIEKVDPGWYKGTITKGGLKKVGLFPANHVKLLNDTSEY